MRREDGWDGMKSKGKWTVESKEDLKKKRKKRRKM